MAGYPHLRAAFGWGLLLVTDDSGPGASAIPSWTNDSLVSVAGDRTAVAVRVQHAVDGEVTVRIVPEPPATCGPADFDGELAVPSRRLRLSDADGRNAVFVEIPEGRARVRIFCNAPSNPDSVDVVVD